MNPFGISDKSYDLLLAAFSKFPEVEKVIIFGSRAKGNFKHGSDIDLAIKGKGCNEKIILNINAYLNEELPLPYHIDVVYYEGLEHTDLKEHINRVGKLLYDSKNASMVNEPLANYKTDIEKQI